MHVPYSADPAAACVRRRGMPRELLSFDAALAACKQWGLGDVAVRPYTDARAYGVIRRACTHALMNMDTLNDSSVEHEN